MHCQRIFFWIFLVIYILTGLILAILAYLFHNTSDGYNQYGSHISKPGRYYIGGIALYILITSIIHIITSLFCKKKLIFFRFAIIFLVLGILIEITIVAIIFLMRSGIPTETRKTTMIVLSSVTGYLVILQIYGIIASLSYHDELQHNYQAVSTK